MSFIETPRFPDDISYGATGGPVWQTDVAKLDSGIEYRNQGWSQSGFKADVAHAARLKAHYDSLLAFFNAVQGRTHGFRFKNWADYSATASEGVFVVIDATHVQMYKRYTAGALSYNKKITKPIAATIVVTGGTGPTVASTTGIVTYSGSTPTAWVGEYDEPCRFDIDFLDAQIITRSGGGLLMGLQSVPIVGLKL